MTGARGRAIVLFLDANVLVSAAWKETSEIAGIWKIHGAELVTSGYVMGEVLRNLHETSQIERLRGLMTKVKVLTQENLPEVAECRILPEKDRPVLAGAIAAGADHLVSGDKKHFGELYGKRIHEVRITPPPELLRVLRRKPLRRSASRDGNAGGTKA